MERRNNILLKVLLWPFIYIGMLFCLGNHSIYAKETCRIETASYILQASGFDEIFVMNKQSEKLVRLGSMRLGWSPAIVPEACTYEMVKEDGCQAIRAHFTFPERDDSGRKIPETLVLTGTYIARPSAVDVHYTVSGMPEGYVEKKWGGSQFRFVLLGERSLELPVAKTGLWQRHSEGGLPIEEFDAKFVPFRNGNYKICLAYNKGNSANLNWKDEGFRHTVFTEKSLQGEKVLDTRFSVVIASADESYEVISSRWHGRPFALTLTTDKTYNWWEDALETLEVNVNVTNTAQEKKNFRLNYWVRDFKGNVVVRQSEALVLASGECVVRPVRFRSEQERDLFFVEASLVDNEGREQVFSRTNICVLPPHKFFSSPEKSIMGLSAYWEIPDLDNLSRLLQRMGVKWLRNGDTANFPSIWAMFHNNVNWKKEWDEQMRKRTVRACLEKMVCNGNRIWEFGNEINMDNAGIAVSKDGIGGAVLLDEALSVASQADVIVAAVGESSEMSGESSSRTNLEMPDAQRDLLTALKKTGKPIVLVYFAGRSTVMTWEQENLPAILNVWFGGSEAADAICDVVFGDVSPSGKLTTTFPKNVGQIPLYYNHLNTGRPLEAGKWFSKFRSNYLDIDNDPLYPFGYGLSYTTFRYGDLQLSNNSMNEKGKITASVTVTNTGNYDADEIVQMYIRDMVGSVARPVKELKGFERIHLKKGESRTVSFDITAEQLKFYNSALNWVCEPGEFEVMVGGNSRDVQTKKFSLQ